MDKPVPASSTDWKSIALALVALAGAGGGGLGLGTQISQGKDAPDVVVYRMSQLEQAVQQLAGEVRTLTARSADRWTREDHQDYAREVDARLDALERRD